MQRRPSATESNSSSSDINFDDVDDQHLFAYMGDGEDAKSPSSSVSKTYASLSLSLSFDLPLAFTADDCSLWTYSVEFRLDFSSRLPPSPSPSSGKRSVKCTVVDRAAPASILT